MPVYAVAGAGMRAAVQDLQLRPDIRLVDTPRAAAILLLAGPTHEADLQALARLHDTLPHPRATVTWRTRDVLATLDAAAAAPADDDDPGPAIRAVFPELLNGARASEPAILPDIDAVEWRGVGPYGQGGSGMTGGTPYGRPMAELGPDRDGLRLDVLPMTLGPFMPRLPAGLVLAAGLSGDVMTGVAVTTSGPVPSSPAVVSPFIRALSGPVTITELELARARDHLRWLSDALVAQGLLAMGRRALRLAHRARPGEGDLVRALGNGVRRTGVYRWSLPRAGLLKPAGLTGLGLGPIARAGGIAEDVRLEDAGYRALDFTPVVMQRGDPAGWWRVRIEEAARSLDLAAAAGDRTTALVGRVESPRGRLEPGDSPTERALELVPDLLSGLEWGDGLATLIGLDLDLDESAAASDAGGLRATA